MIESAGTTFVLVAFALPVAAAIVAVALRNMALLNLVHVTSGAIWAGATLFVAGVFGPTLLGLEPRLRGQVNTPMIPKNVFLFSGVAIAALLTGPVMAVRMGLWDLSNPYVLAAVVIALALLVAGRTWSGSRSRCSTRPARRGHPKASASPPSGRRSGESAP